MDTMIASPIKVILLASFFWIGSSPDAYAFKWKEGALAAVSVTADDGWTSELEEAEILDEYKLRGTFYLAPNFGNNPTGSPVIPRANKWRSVFLKGHEIGNHTWSHPCGFPFPTQSPLTKLKDMTWPGVADEVGQTEQWLHENIYETDRFIDHTFAYPCGHLSIGYNYGWDNEQAINRATEADKRTWHQRKQVGACEYSALLAAYPVVPGDCHDGPGGKLEDY